MLLWAGSAPSGSHGFSCPSVPTEALDPDPAAHVWGETWLANHSRSVALAVGLFLLGLGLGATCMLQRSKVSVSPRVPCAPKERRQEEGRSQKLEHGDPRPPFFPRSWWGTEERVVPKASVCQCERKSVCV